MKHQVLLFVSALPLEWIVLLPALSFRWVSVKLPSLLFPGIDVFAPLSATSALDSVNASSTITKRNSLFQFLTRLSIIFVVVVALFFYVIYYKKQRFCFHGSELSGSMSSFEAVWAVSRQYEQFRGSMSNCQAVWAIQKHWIVEQ